MFVLFTDFGEVGPYAGQMKAVLSREAPGVEVVDLVHDAPAFQARASAYLLASLIDVFPAGSVFLCVVDPGVGGARATVAAEADGRWFVGPENGLFEIVLRRANTTALWDITWRPDNLSASFHGRDLFAPVAAMIACGEAVPGEAVAEGEFRRPDWPDDLAEIIYIDRFGNAMTGLRAPALSADSRLMASGHTVTRARTFSDLPPGTPFWYENSCGLAEIAVNQGRADTTLGLAIGTPVVVHGG